MQGPPPAAHDVEISCTHRFRSMAQCATFASEFEAQDNAADVVVRSPAEGFFCQALGSCFSILNTAQLQVST